MTQIPNQEDPFDSLLTLEDTLYTAAYSQGVTDGALAGRIEGRIFGLEKGFEKFAALGHLHGRSVVWGARLPPSSDVTKLPLLHDNSRLANNITLLHALTDPDTFDTANIEEAVADFDDRFKRAGAKAKVVERILGESQNARSSQQGSPAGGSKHGPVRVSGQGRKGNKGIDDGIEDFAGSRLLQ